MKNFPSQVYPRMAQLQNMRSVIVGVAVKYRYLGKRLHPRLPSRDCQELLENAKGMIEMNVLEDPRYHIANNKLG